MLWNAPERGSGAGGEECDKAIQALTFTRNMVAMHRKLAHMQSTIIAARRSVTEASGVAAAAVARSTSLAVVLFRRHCFDFRRNESAAKTLKASRRRHNGSRIL